MLRLQGPYISIYYFSYFISGCPWSQGKSIYCNCCLRFCVFAFLRFLRFCGGNAPNYARVNVASSSSYLICLCWCHTFRSETFLPTDIWSTTCKIRLVQRQTVDQMQGSNKCRPSVCRSNVCRPKCFRSKGMEPSCYQTMHFFCF